MLSRVKERESWKERNKQRESIKWVNLNTIKNFHNVLFLFFGTHSPSLPFCVCCISSTQYLCVLYVISHEIVVVGLVTVLFHLISLCVDALDLKKLKSFVVVFCCCCSFSLSVFRLLHVGPVPTTLNVMLVCVFVGWPHQVLCVLIFGYNILQVENSKELKR